MFFHKCIRRFSCSKELRSEIEERLRVTCGLNVDRQIANIFDLFEAAYRLGEYEYDLSDMHNKIMAVASLSRKNLYDLVESMHLKSKHWDAGRKLLARIVGENEEETSNSLTAKLIFGAYPPEYKFNNANYDNSFIYPSTCIEGNVLFNSPSIFFYTSGIKKVYFNDPATVVIWRDGSKTIVRAENEEYDPEKGLAMAICKKIMGNKGNYYETFKKWIPENK